MERWLGQRRHEPQTNMEATPIGSEMSGDRAAYGFGGALSLLIRSILKQRRQRASLRKECQALRYVFAMDRYIGGLDRDLAKPSLVEDAANTLLARE